MDIAFKIVNVVATAALDQAVDLEFLPRLSPGIVISDPAVYPLSVPATSSQKPTRPANNNKRGEKLKIKLAVMGGYAVKAYTSLLT